MGTQRTGRRRAARTLAALMAGTALLCAAAGGTARAQTAASGVASLNIPAQPLSSALIAYSRQTGVDVFADADLTAGKRSAAVSGALPPREALARLLAGTGLSFSFADARTATIAPGARGAGQDGGAATLAPISVVGSAEPPPGPATVDVTAADLERRNPQDLRQVFAGEPALKVGSSIPMSQKLYVNGIEETNLAVTVDGSRQNNKVFHHNGTNLIDPALLKAVRVDKGVAPADAGPGALAGAVAFDTKDARDLLDGDGFGGSAKASFDTNSDVLTTGLTAYGMQDGFEFLAFLNRGKGGKFTAGNGDAVNGTATDFISGLGKLAWQSEAGHRFEVSHERVHDDAKRPFRANIGFIEGRPGWEPRVRDYRMDRENTVFSYTDAKPEGLWDPTLVLAYSETKVVTPVGRPPNIYDEPGDTRSINGKFENRFGFDLGSVTAGLDFYSDRARLEDPTLPARERAKNVGLYAQARLEPTDRARLSFGARGDRQWFESANDETFTNTGFSGNASAEYDILPEHLTAKVGVSRVWAGIPLAENFILNPNWAHDDLDPMTAENRMMVLVARWEGFTVEGSVFRTWLHDARDPAYHADLGAVQREVQSRGWEIGAGYAWADGFARVKYVNIDVDIDDGPADSDLGTYLATPVGEIVTVEAAHSFRDLGLRIGADAEFAFDYDRVPDGSRSYDAYQVVNAFAEYRLPLDPLITLRLDIRNIFDETYADRATYGQEFGTVTPLYQPGRTFLLTAGVAF